MGELKIRLSFVSITHLWIAVLIVRASCSIEVYGSSEKSENFEIGTRGNKNSNENIHNLSIGKNGCGGGKKIPCRPNSKISRFSSSTTTEAKATKYEDETCQAKADGYYTNKESGCTSYYFCGSGYQITYICPTGKKFNGKECKDDFVCPHPQINLCKDSPNGYYPHPFNPEVYFYCFQKQKVIDLRCDTGKIFRGGKCIWKEDEIHTTELVNLIDSTCEGKRNGFFPDLSTDCVKYYFCIHNIKTELECRGGQIFNGEICVSPLKYKCPGHSQPPQRLIIVGENKLNKD